jgi:hypothetical protein
MIQLHLAGRRLQAMLRRSRHIPALAVAACSLLAGPLLDFSDASHGWLVYGGVTWRTSDGGINWT